MRSGKEKIPHSIDRDTALLDLGGLAVLDMILHASVGTAFGDLDIPKCGIDDVDSEYYFVANVLAQSHSSDLHDVTCPRCARTLVTPKDGIVRACPAGRLVVFLTDSRQWRC